MTTLSTLKAHSFKLATGGFLAFVLVATGCQPATESKAIISDQSTGNSSTSVVTDMSQQTLRQQALRIQRALANHDFARITDDIHPTRGVRFSMYAYIEPESDKVFSREQYAQYLQASNIRFTWGEKDGTGEPLIISLPKYLTTWVHASTFSQNPTISINDSKATGNSINNLESVYPHAHTVEFYQDGSDEYGGMDWRAIRLVFDDYQGQRYLVAIINDQWTI